MAEPISLFHVRDHSRDLAFSALPHAPVRGRRDRRRQARAVAGAIHRRTVSRRPPRAEHHDERAPVGADS